MTFLQLLLKNLRQRAFSGTLTALGVALGTALGVGLLALHREAPKLFGQAEFGYNVVVGGKGDPLGLVLNNVYLLGSAPPTAAWAVYEDLTGRDPDLARHVEWAVPLAWGDTHRGRRILGTTTAFFTHFEPRAGESISVADGKPFDADTWQAVVGSRAARDLRIDVGTTLQAFHGDERTGHLHDERWQVVGILAPTGTAYDDAIFVPVATQYALGDHGEGLLDQGRLRLSPDAVADLYAARAAELEATIAAGGEAHEGYVITGDGRVLPRVPQELWRLSGILVRARPGFGTSTVEFRLNTGDAATAALPARVMGQFYDTFLRTPGVLLLLVTAAVTVVAAVSILVSIYNSVQARRREIATLRSLGATRARVLSLVTAEAATLGIAGAAAGFVGGRLVAFVADVYLRGRLGGGIAWWTVGPLELAYVAGVVVLSAVAGLIPALLAYRTPVAQNLEE